MAFSPSFFGPVPVTEAFRGGKRNAETKMDRVELLEERVAHLTRAVDDLSDVVAAQRKELDRLNRLVGLLVEREAEREAMAGEAPAANQPPPHW
jgi:SlyX protein